MPTIDPSIKYDWSIRMMQQALYDGLVKYVGNPPEVQPWLAERWEASPDAKTWTFHLVKNARFHNGDPVTAEAVRWSFARTLKLNQGPAWMLSDFLKEDGIKVVNEHTIQFTLTQPYAAFLSFVPWWYVMNPKQVTGQRAGRRPRPEVAHRQRGGQRAVQDQALAAGRALRDRGGGRLLEGLAVEGPRGRRHLKLVREAAAQRAALLRGEADIAEGLTADDYDVVAKTPGHRRAELSRPDDVRHQDEHAEGARPTTSTCARRSPTPSTTTR